MARPRTRIPLNVFLNGRLVGRLNRQSSGAIDFTYDPDWLGWEHAMPVSFSLPLREDRYIGGPVIAVFDNLLPDNQQVRRRMAERVKADNYDAYSLLAAVGRDCVGALQILPEGESPGAAGSLSGRPLAEGDIAGMLSNLANTPLGVDESEEFRISLAGAQEKTALLRWEDRWQLPHGTTATTHILKPEIGMLRNGIDFSKSIENEYLCMHLTAALGLPTADVDMHTFAKKSALVVTRFDRQWTSDQRLLRLPQEDCCQALSVPPTNKYESHGGPGIEDILKLLQASDEPEADQYQFFKTQVVFWLLGATDGHAKNFSLFILPGGRFRLTPLYDVMSVQPNVDSGQISYERMKFSMAVGKGRKFGVDEITPRHFIETAMQLGLSTAFIQRIFTELKHDAETAIDSTLKSLPVRFPEDLATSVVDGFRGRLNLIA